MQRQNLNATTKMPAATDADNVQGNSLIVGQGALDQQRRSLGEELLAAPSLTKVGSSQNLRMKERTPTNHVQRTSGNSMGARSPTAMRNSKMAAIRNSASQPQLRPGGPKVTPGNVVYFNGNLKAGQDQYQVVAGPNSSVFKAPNAYNSNIQPSSLVSSSVQNLLQPVDHSQYTRKPSNLKNSNQNLN